MLTAQKCSQNRTTSLKGIVETRYNISRTIQDKPKRCTVGTCIRILNERMQKSYLPDCSQKREPHFVGLHFLRV